MKSEATTETVSIDVDDRLLQAAHAETNAETLSGTVERALWLVLVLDNPEAMLAHGDAPFDDPPEDPSRR